VNEVKDVMDFLLVILNIKFSTEEERIDLDKQMVVVYDFLKTKFGHLTIPEIKEAFKMYVAKEFPEIKVFRLLDCVAIGEVLTAYTDFRNESLRIYDQKKKQSLQIEAKASEDDKKKIREEFTIHLFEEMKSKGFSNDARLLFEELEEKGKLILGNSKKAEIYQKQFEKTIFNLKAKNLKSPSNELKEKIKTMEEINSKGRFVKTVVDECRALSVCDYLSDYLENFEEFKKAIT